MEKLRSAEIDMAVMTAPKEHKALFEVPLYYERFVASVAEVNAPMWSTGPEA